jgi:hypothetical protein
VYTRDFGCGGSAQAIHTYMQICLECFAERMGAFPYLLEDIE